MTDDDSPLIFPFVSFLLCSLACLPFSLPGPNRSSMNATRHQIRTSTSMRQFSRSTFQHTSKLLIQVRKTIAIFLFGPFFAVKEAPISSHLISFSYCRRRQVERNGFLARPITISLFLRRRACKRRTGPVPGISCLGTRRRNESASLRFQPRCV